MEEKRVAIKVPVYEYERGWGNRLDDYMVCQTVEEADKFIKEFNSRNNLDQVPDWYMKAVDRKEPVDLTIAQHNALMSDETMWWSHLKYVN